MSWRYLKEKKRNGFISMTSWFSFLGIVLGVATLVVVMSVMNGFKHELLSKILGMNGHLGVYSYTQDFSENLGTATTKNLKKIQTITQINPVIERQCLLMSDKRASGALVHGMFQDDLKNKTFISKKDPRILKNFKKDVLVMGYKLAEKLGVREGDYITVMSPEGTQTALGVIPRTKTFQILYLFNSEMYEYDNTFAFMPMESCQDMFQMKQKITGLEIFVKNPLDTESTLEKIEKFLGKNYLHIFDWQKANGQFFSAIQIQRNVMFFILSLIILVASFNIISTLTMLVKEKSSSIAILKTMGASRAMIRGIFFRIGATIGVLGSFLGGALGLGFSYNIDRIRKFLESISSTHLFSAEVYFLAHLPAKVDPLEIFYIIFFSIVLSLLATLYPAYQASTLSPVEVLKYE